jgi:hypothetical protein
MPFDVPPKAWHRASSKDWVLNIRPMLVAFSRSRRLQTKAQGGARRHQRRARNEGHQRGLAETHDLSPL